MYQTSIEQVLTPVKNAETLMFRSLPIVSSKVGAVKYIRGNIRAQSYILPGDYIRVNKITKTYYEFEDVEGTISRSGKKYEFKNINEDTGNDGIFYQFNYNDSPTITVRDGFTITASLAGIYMDGNTYISADDWYLIYDDNRWKLMRTTGNHEILLNDSLKYWIIMEDNAGELIPKYEYINVYLDLMKIPPLNYSSEIVDVLAPAAISNTAINPDYERFNAASAVSTKGCAVNTDENIICLDSGSVRTGENSFMFARDSVDNLIGRLNMLLACELKKYWLFTNVDTIAGTTTNLYKHIRFLSNVSINKDIHIGSCDFRTSSNGMTQDIYLTPAESDTAIIMSENIRKTLMRGNITEHIIDVTNNLRNISVKTLKLGYYRYHSKNIYVVCDTLAATLMNEYGTINNVCFKSMQLDDVEMMMNQSSQTMIIPALQSVTFKVVDEFNREIPRVVNNGLEKIAENNITLYLSIM